MPHVPLKWSDVPEAVRVHRPNGGSDLVILCEHASHFIPKELNHLGLAEADRQKHIAWDRGALDVSLGLSEVFDAPVVAATVSRLVFDCNRDVAARDAVVTRSEDIEIPGNRGLSAAEIAARAAALHAPFHQAADQLLSKRKQPIVVTMHSFTPVFHGQQRYVQLGLLADQDERLARAMLPLAPALTPWVVALNEPYHPKDGMTYSARAHALPRGALHVMFEVRNDLISTRGGVAQAVRLLAALLTKASAACGQALQPVVPTAGVSRL